MGLFMVAFSLSANNIGGGCTTGLAQKAFGDWGLSAVWYVLAASIAMIPLAYFAPKIRKTMAVTIPEVVGRRFDKFSSNFTAILSVLSLFCLTSSQIAASGGVRRKRLSAWPAWPSMVKTNNNMPKRPYSYRRRSQSLCGWDTSENSIEMASVVLAPWPNQ